MLTISKDLPLGVCIHPALNLKRKSQIIQLRMHVHVASSTALQTHQLPTTIFKLDTSRQKEPGDEPNTNIALLSAMKQQSLMLLVAYAMTDFAL